MFLNENVKSLFLFLLAFSLNACNTNSVPGTNKKIYPPYTPPKNIILLIGDGMGLSQITAGMYQNKNHLEIERLPYIGLQKTYAADDLITDSAAAATAIATGNKTYNGAISVDTDSIPLSTILEKAEDKSMATGMVVTSTIVHATPAAFIAHDVSRNHYEAIATDFLDTEIDLFIGGGRKYFDQRKSDERDLVKELTAKGYECHDLVGRKLPKIKDSNKNIGIFTDDSDPATTLDGRDYLAPATKWAIDFLNNRGDNGFFLMVEGSQIDWGGHANDVTYVITEMLDFDKAVGKALDFAALDGETLVIVTADHETGGFSVNLGSSMDTIISAFNTEHHTADLIPVFAYGPGANLFTGIYENTEIYYKMRELMGISAGK